MNSLSSRNPVRVHPQEQIELNIAANKLSWKAKYLDAAITGIGQQLLRTDTNSYGERIIAEALMDELFSQRLTAREEEQVLREKWKDIEASLQPPFPVG